MCRFLIAGQKVPEHCRILQIRAWIPLLCVDEYGELHPISNEEDRCVIANKIPIALFCVKFDAETSRIAGRVGRTFFTTNGRAADGNLGLLSNRTKEVCRGLGGVYSQSCCF